METIKKEEFERDAIAGTSTILKRVEIFLEDEEWERADEYCEKVLDIDAENAEAYLGKLMAELHISKKEDLSNYNEPFDDRNNYHKVMRFCDDKLRTKLEKDNEIIKERNHQEYLEGLYSDACNKMEKAKTENDYKNAAKSFEEIIDFSDAKEKKEKCFELAGKTRIDKKARVKKHAILVAIALVVVIVFTTVIQPMMNYNAAVSLMEEGKYKEAITAFEELNDYKDSVDKLDACCLSIMNENNYNLWKNTEIGDSFTFGNYEGETEWILLDKYGTTLLIISKNAVDCAWYGKRPFSFNDSTPKVGNTTWESSYLRWWLNDCFINEAFSTEEQSMIVTTKVSNPNNPEYNTDGGNDTEDKIFLLSIEEAEKYFSSKENRQCKPSAYAKGNGASVSDNGNCFWWLRSPGMYENYAARVDSDGYILEFGTEVFSHYSDHAYTAVRPALWIDLAVE